jgi:carbamoyltransferase
LKRLEPKGYILGISAFYHDSSACLIKDNEIICAIQEERISRKKQDDRLPVKAVEVCLEQAGIVIEDIDLVVFYEKPFLKFERVIETYVQAAPMGFLAFRKAVKSWMGEKLWIPSIIKKRLKYKGEIWFVDHHEAHAASSCFTAPFNNCAFLTIDAVGEKSCTSYGTFENGKLETREVQNYPHSVGYLYSAFTQYCGFKVNSGEYKLMGLAPFGEPKYVELIKNEIVDVRVDGSIELQMDKFHFHKGLKMINRSFGDVFGKPARKPESDIDQFYKDVACSIQKVVEEIVINLVQYVKNETGEENLCLAGGVALNCTANGVVSRANIFKNIWIQPACGDAGGALGAAAIANFQQNGISKLTFDNSYHGKEFGEADMLNALDKLKVKHKIKTSEEVKSEAVRLLVEGKIIGWYQGRDEWGARALGNRSIIASPTIADMKSRINLAIKKREGFRPFAPVVLEEDYSDWFVGQGDNEYMQYTVKAQQQDLIPACVHVDGTSRVQTINESQNELLYQLISSFKKETGVPMLINTSFNERGEPMVHSPEDAIRTFFNTELDTLVLGNILIHKEENREVSIKRKKYELD